MDYDLLLKGGHLIDPKNQWDGIADVAVKDGKIAAVGADLFGFVAKLLQLLIMLAADLHLGRRQLEPHLMTAKGADKGPFGGRPRIATASRNNRNEGHHPAAARNSQ